MNATHAVSEKTDGNLKKLQDLVGQVRKNYTSLQKDVDHLQQKQHDDQTKQNHDLVTVSRKDLLHLQRELKMLKGMLSKTINQDVLPAYQTIQSVSADAQNAQEATMSAETERDHWKSQWEVSLQSIQSEKEEKMALRCELQETTDQLVQQSEFCAAMGSACCTLLWRVSRCEESIQSILVGSKVDEFLSLVSSTILSYLHTYEAEAPDDNSEESQFVLALCGVITNIAASAFGRDFLMKNMKGPELVDTYIQVISEVPCTKFAKMKNLILMALYNLTINQKGLKYISSKSGLLSLLVWQLQDNNEAENRLNSLRLIQSLLYEQQSAELIHEAKEVLSEDFLEHLCRDPRPDIRQGAAELMTDLMTAGPEQ